MNFTVYPAIDVRGGRMVRLRQGDYAQETRYTHGPLAAATRYAAEKARWLHLVDLDAARSGGYTLTALLQQMRRDTGLKLQTGGGIRRCADVAALLEAGADRVVIGSMAVQQPSEVMQWLREFDAERLAIALDARQDGDGEWRLPVHGWTETSAVTLFDLSARYADAGLQHLLCTDISRDGMLCGPSLQLYTELCRRLPGIAVQASGGIRSVDDIMASRDAGCAGAVLGKALLDGGLNLSEALRC